MLGGIDYRTIAVAVKRALSALANIPSAKGDLWTSDGTLNQRLTVGADGQVVAADSTQTYGLRYLDPPARGMLAGSGLTWVSGTSITVAAGTSRDDADTETMKQSGSITMSNLTVGWVVGNNQPKIRTGVVLANGMSLHFYRIKRVDTGVVDIFVSDETSNPTLPTNYTKSRRIASLKFTAGAQTFPNFTQFGDDFYLAAPVKDVNATAMSAVALTTFSVPTGINVRPRLALVVGQAGGVANSGYYVALGTAALGTGGIAPAAAVFVGPNSSASYNTTDDFTTNTSAQLYYAAVSGADFGTGSFPSGGTPTTPTIQIYTHGWVDKRGKDA